MKKIVFLSLVALCLPWTLAAQSVVDDLYYVPSKKEKAEQKKDRPKNETVVVTPADEVVVKSNTPMTVHASDGQTTVVVRDAKGNTRDVDEYNRRYEASDYDFTAQNDTLYIDEKPYDGLDGEWVGGEFEGSADDYEYATRIIRFRNPRYAIPISSPLYFDVVYGLNTWDWNVYTDGLYAYAFPTFTNRLWWDWRYNWSWGWPYYGWNWGWSGFYFGWGGFYAGWSGWYGPGWGWHHPYYGPGWGWHHHHHPSYWGPRNTYTARRSVGRSSYRAGGSVVNGGGAVRTSATRTYGSSSYREGVRGSSTGVRRVVGTRSATDVSTGSSANRSSYSRDNAYTRPNRGSGTRVETSSGAGVNTNRGTYTRSSSRRSSGATYSRGSSRSTTRSYSPSNHTNRRSTFSNPSRSSSSSHGSFRSGGGSSSRSYGGGGATRSGGGSRRR